MTLEECIPLRDALAKAWSFEEFRVVVDDLEKHFTPYVNGEKTWTPPSEDHHTARLSLPPWHCQPYVRMAPEDHIKKMELLSSEQKRKHESMEKDNQEPAREGGMSKKKLKKLAKLAKKGPRGERLERPPEMCIGCPNFPVLRLLFLFLVLHFFIF